MPGGSGLSPIDYAVLLTGAHPELSSPDPTVQNQVKVHIGNQRNALYNLAMSISKQGAATESGGWATKVQVGKLGAEAVFQYNLSQATLTAAGEVIQKTLKEVKQDSSLQNKLWNIQEGFSGSYQPVVPPASGFTWTADRFRPRYGITVQSVSANLQASQFQAVLQNNYPAFYGLYAEFLDASGSIITPEGWVSRLSKNSPFETKTMKFLGFVPPTLAIEGMPASPGQSIAICTVPKGTASIRLTFGSLGVLGWNATVNSLPLMFSAVLGYAVPWFMKSAGGYSPAEAAWYFGLLANSAVATELVAAAEALSATTSTQDAIDMLSRQIGKLLFGGSLPKLLSSLCSKYDDAVLIQAAQGINWPLAGLLSSIQTGVVSGVVETLSVPARFQQVYSMEMITTSHVAVVPDPIHEAWPLTAVSYTIRWKGNGRSKNASGDMHGIWSSATVSADFPDVPRDTAISAQACVYSAAGKVVGQGEARGLASSSLRIVIRESAPDVRQGYQQVMELAYESTAGFSWQPASTSDTSTITSLRCSNNGTNLCQLTGISYNATAAVIVYGWRASGITASPCGERPGAGQQLYRLQAVSVSSSAQRSLKPASCGFYTMTMIACGSDSHDNLFFDTRCTPYALRNIVLGDAGPFQFPDDQCRGYLTLSVIDDLLNHPLGFAAAVSTSENMLQIVQINKQQSVNGNAVPIPYSVGGAGTRDGLLLQPVAVAAAPDGSLIVLESGNKRLQAFDVYGNNVKYFGSSATLPLQRQTGITYLDLEIDGSGNMYVLSFTDSGAQADQYHLDVYDAKGVLLSSTKGVNAARIAVDPWCNVYGLGYRLIPGPEGDTSPAIRVWSPIAT